MNFKVFKNYFFGVILSVAIAVAATFSGKIVPVMGASIFALLFGLGINFLFKSKDFMAKGLKFTSKTVLKTAIVLLGAGLNINLVLTVGKYSFYVMLFTLIAAFGFGITLGKILKVNWKMSSLISAGTGICGGSAIAAIAPTIDADESDITYSIAATFIFDIVMIILFPLMGKALGLSDMAYGLWTGTAVNDTSSVVAASYAFSDAAGDFATIVKLTRTLSIIPIVLIFTAIGLYAKRKESKNSNTFGEAKISTGRYILKIAPWFILLFVGMAILNTLGIFSDSLISILKNISRFFMAMALAAIGVNTNIKKMLKSGINPMILGFLVSAIVVVVSLIAQHSLGQI